MDNLTMHQRLVDFIGGFPQGVSAGEIERHFDISRTTLNRWLKEALRAGTVTVTGKGNNLAEARRFWKKMVTKFHAREKQSSNVICVHFRSFAADISVLHGCDR
jgi:transposase-like protein